jgi:hypothetical protein
MEYPWEVRDRAKELYCIDGLTFEQVAEATKVSVSQLKRWSAEEEELGNPSWPDQKREYRQALSEIRRNTILLRKKLIKQALNTLDPQHVYAVSRLEAISTKAAHQEEPPPPVEITREINTPAEAVAALEQAVELKLNIMLTQPGKISLAGIKEVKQCLELVEKMKAKEQAGQDLSSGERRQVIDEAIETIYGVKLKK